MVKKTSALSGSKKDNIKKRYLKSGNKCKVTFRLPKEAAGDVKRVYLVGDFNNWNTKASPMNRLKSGEFKLELNLDAGKEYRFKYLIDDNRWENHWNADKYVSNKFGTDDSVVVV